MTRLNRHEWLFELGEKTAREKKAQVKKHPCTYDPAVGECSGTCRGCEGYSSDLDPDVSDPSLD